MEIPSLEDALENWATVRPDAPFVTEAETGATITYGEARLAVMALRRSLGPEPRTVVNMLPGGILAAVLWLATLGGGHHLVLSTPEAGDADKATIARFYRPDVVVAEGTEAAQGFGSPSNLTILTRDALGAIVRARTDADVRDVAARETSREGRLSLTTSGTTGTPKGVTLSARQIAWTAEQVRLSHHLTSDDRGFSSLPFSHINAPVVSLSATLLAGASVVMAARFSKSRFWSWLDRECVTWASIVPAIVAMLLQTDPPSWLPGSLRFVRTASAPLPASHLLAFEERFGVPVVETYGLSEAASQVAANPVPPGIHKPGSVGLPAGVSMRICFPLDTGSAGALRDVPMYSEGEICISGPSVISSYDGGASPESFVDGWFRTGDLGRLDADGYIHITGRLRDVINRGGEKIAPREVEETLLVHPDVQDVVVVGEPDPIFGQRAVAYVVPYRTGLPDLEARLLDHAAARLTRYKVPSAVVEVESLPRTRTGKVQRQLVSSLSRQRQTAGSRAG